MLLVEFIFQSDIVFVVDIENIFILLMVGGITSKDGRSIRLNDVRQIAIRDFLRRSGL